MTNIGEEFSKIPKRFAVAVTSAFTKGLAELGPTAPSMSNCPPNSYPVWNGNCIANRVDREDGVNWAEALWSHSDKSDGCSWNRHVEAAVCFRACPVGFSGRAYEGCYANGADSLGVMRYSTDRLVCPNDRNLIAGLCYKK